MAKKKQKPKKAKKIKRALKKRKPKVVKKRPKIKKKRKARPVKKAKPRKKVKKAKDVLSELAHKTRIRVIGIGGGGGSIISEIAPHVKRVDFIASNTDSQALKEVSRGIRTFQFGQKVTHGLGCGMDARTGQKAAKEDRDKITKLFNGIDLCVLVASLGGGTGSGATPEFAKIARETGTMLFGIFTTPFKFEGGKRSYIARGSLEKLTPNLNAISIIPNENIFQIIDKKTPIKQAFSAINKRLAENLRGFIEMIYVPGLINIDFADVKAILDGKGKLAYLNSAQAQGPNRVDEALKEVLNSPLNEYNIKGAEKIVFNITASQNIGMKEVEQISKTISDFNRRAKIIFGISQDNSYKDKIKITLLAVGCGKEEKPKSKPKPKIIIKRKPKPKKKPKPRTKPKPKSRTKSKAKLKPKSKTKTKVKSKSKIKPKRKLKRRVKPKSKPKKKRKEKKAKKAILTAEPAPVKEDEEPQSRVLTRKNALDLRRDIQKTEEEMVEQEKKWDIPAFLRRNTDENK